MNGSARAGDSLEILLGPLVDIGRDREIRFNLEAEEAREFEGEGVRLERNLTRFRNLKVELLPRPAIGGEFVPAAEVGLEAGIGSDSKIAVLSDDILLRNRRLLLNCKAGVF